MKKTITDQLSLGWFWVSGLLILVTISGSVLEADNVELTNLLNKLDQLLYRAKHKSKNLIEYLEISG
jgi:GGDEF domain-containing protein